MNTYLPRNLINNSDILSQSDRYRTSRCFCRIAIEEIRYSETNLSSRACCRPCCGVSLAKLRSTDVFSGLPLLSRSAL
jgi:hypothetical protein